ncbi:MAG: hypothetical protein EOP86_16520 [Verrucomicrobiaceae bacterium]|nr:MAG: hypothetical protein EOP86_16520 [Verrucomicrobiaceae bacterium]
MASCILVGILLVFLGALGGGGFWAYKKYGAPYFAKSGTPEVADNGTGQKAVKEGQPETPPATKTVPAPPPVKETPAKDDPLAATPSQEKPVTEPAPPVKPEVADNTPKDPPPAPTPEPEPPVQPDPAPAPEPPPSVPDNPDPVVPAEPVKTFAANAPEVMSLKADADQRIDEAPADIYSDDDKEKVREAIRQAKRLTRVATLQFGKGAAALGGNERKRLKTALLTPEAEALLSDPQAVFFLIGFADSSGASQTNRSLSQKRAAGVGSVLRSFRVSNRAYAVGLGSSKLVGGAQEDKNRAVEVWIVLP